MTTYQRRRREEAERRRQAWSEKKDQVRQWLIDNDAPQDVIDLLDAVASPPTYSWC